MWQFDYSLPVYVFEYYFWIQYQLYDDESFNRLFEEIDKGKKNTHVLLFKTNNIWIAF
jgi:regulatory protein YycH of two-component signal transduction system YycFG